MKAPEIYVNARFLTQPITGVQRFAIEISKQLKTLIPHLKFISPQNVLHSQIALELEVILIGKYSGHVWEQCELPLYLKKKGAVLLINLANTAPIFFYKNVVTIHDLAFMVNPSWFSKPFYFYYKWLVPKICKQALQIFTVSEFSKMQISHLLNISTSKITVAYNAVSESLLVKPCTTMISVAEAYILSVASVNPRKNLICLIQAFQKLPDKNIKLYLVGRKNKVFADSNFMEVIQNDPNILFLENVSDSELALLYQKARLYVNPSLYEGFGIPNLEAMAFNCPVITSDIEVFKEVCGRAALYFDPNDSNELAEKIILLLRAPEKQEILKNRGIKQAAQFSWINSAKKYKTVVDTKVKE